MHKRNKQQMEELEKEWLGFGRFVLKDDENPSDHEKINAWIIALLGKSSRSDEEEHIVSCVYHAVTSDIPFSATKIIRKDLLRVVRMKIADSSLRTSSV